MATMMLMSRASSRRGLRGLATSKVSIGPNTTSTPDIIRATVTAPARYQPGQRYHPRYRAPNASASRHVLPSRCSPNALNLNLMLPQAGDSLTQVQQRTDELAIVAPTLHRIVVDALTHL